ncbi:TIGR03086 family metal-binding protein [Umezawaea endophytica]|uniref:TIGR03086 family metal-binding protein n=1 Tax=Umezawaea endophytica TaxID=1654476 RepID=A0A9X3A4V9_9PSEU|nr:TIGR03086 family metal-binding protein [Umezawaea endophytica]MCS7481663.1 TIGR03086 family metal-binding protein [Umezawaea endophytica]
MSHVDLLERAVAYALGCLHGVTPDALSRPTPCRDWDLRALLRHLVDSLAALREAADDGHVDLEPPPVDHDDPIAATRDHARRLLGAWTARDGRPEVSIGGCPVTTDIVARAGALEVAVHGWDVAHACGETRPIPRALADELYPVALLLVSDADRPARFAAPVEPETPADRLLAYLGRRADGHR